MCTVMGVYSVDDGTDAMDPTTQERLPLATSTTSPEAVGKHPSNDRGHLLTQRSQPLREQAHAQIGYGSRGFPQHPQHIVRHRARK